MFRRTILTLSAAFFLIAPWAQAGDFVRIDEDAKHARLQTALTHYEKNGVVVDLIGAIHIADQGYYDDLNQRFTHYDALLYEMIGGENIAARLDAAKKHPSPAKPGKLDSLHALYDSACRLLKLTSQADGIDYRAKNFVHADLTLDQFETQQAERKESILSFFLINALKSEKTPQPNSIRLARAFLTENTDLAKQELMKTLGSADDQIAAFTGESVIISDRNARCIEVLETQLAKRRKTIGIFYGAAHFPDLEKRLLALGFKRTSQEWLTAWEVEKER